MTSKNKLTNDIILFNILISFFLLLSVEVPLAYINFAEHVRIGLIYLFLIGIVGSRGITVLYPNLPLLIFIVALVGNCYFLNKFKES